MNYFYLILINLLFWSYGIPWYKRRCINIRKIRRYFIEEINFNNYDVGKVIKVIDGDTIKVLFEHGEARNVRLLLINAPEKQNMFFKESKDYATKVLLNKTVYIEFEETKTDMFNRLLGYVWYKENDRYYLFNYEIIKRSLAKVSHVYSDTKYLDILRKAEESTKEFKEYIWEIEGYADNFINKFDMSVYDTFS